VAISKTGVITGESAGSSAITASLNGITSSTQVSVMAAVVTVKSISIAPATISISTGATQQFKVNAIYSDGTTGALASGVTWTSSNTAAATIDANGIATALAVGTSTINAVAKGVSASAGLTVTVAPKTLTTVSVTPQAATVTAGATQQFAATAIYSDGSKTDVTLSGSWSSSNVAVATINSAGVAKSISAGTAAITASTGGKSGTSSLTVAAPVLTEITVKPANPSFTVGSSEQFTATAQYNNGTTADVTSKVTWASSNSAVATISASGLATGQSAGGATISASMNGATFTTQATVTVAPRPIGTVDITTWHVDANRSGLNSKEQVLTPSNVSTTSFGKLFSYEVDGYVYGSPLIKSNVMINGTAHDVLYVATEKDSVYAFDADNYGTGTPLWQISLLKAGESPLINGPIKPYEGVTSTPVIDPSTGTLYVVSALTSSAGSSFRLSALDITTGAQKFGGPVTIQASVAATNSASVNGVQTLNTSCIQRTALLLANGNIYIGFGGCHSGWLLAYSASTLKQVGVFNSSTKLNGEGTYASAGGVWMGGAGPVADSIGNVYVSTGNGPWDGQTAFADSILKFGPTPQAGPNGTMQPIDYFTPYVYQFMNCYDSDLAAGGLLMIPGTTKIISGGKTGTMYLVDGANLGHESNNDTGAIQEVVWGDGLSGGSVYQQSCQDSAGINYANIAAYEIFGTSAYFNGNIYLGVTPTLSGAPAGVRQFIYSGKLTPAGDSANYQLQGTRGTSPFISSNGSNNGIVWMIDQGYPLQSAGSAPTSATLRAYDAANYPKELYDSNMNSGDQPGYGIKFSSPVVANGRVYMTSGHDLTTVPNPQGEIDVYGLK
jgi:uncharacterized protein YjdB